MAQFPVPETRRDLKRFLGMTGYYRAFWQNFFTFVQPLTSFTCPSPLLSCLRTVIGRLLRLNNCCVLTSPDFTKPFKLEVDASGVGAGAVLMQEDSDGVEHPISYFSRKSNTHKVRYSIIEKETLALLWSLQHFDVYVGFSSCPLIVYTDHNPLVFLSRMFNFNKRLMRWTLLIQDYHLVMKHTRGGTLCRRRGTVSGLSWRKKRKTIGFCIYGGRCYGLCVPPFIFALLFCISATKF